MRGYKNQLVRGSYLDIEDELRQISCLSSKKKTTANLPTPLALTCYYMMVLFLHFRQQRFLPSEKMRHGNQDIDTLFGSCMESNTYTVNNLLV
jgi:hypothetical protein